jgi:hypothetical protein
MFHLNRKSVPYAMEDWKNARREVRDENTLG